MLDETAARQFVQCGTIHFGGSHFQLPCVIKDLSRTTARLHVFAAEKLPERFWLRVESLGLDVECTVISRSKKLVTVAFEPGQRQSDVAPAKARATGSRSRSAGGKTPEAVEASPASVRPHTLWIVEDDEDDQQLLSDAFRSIGFRGELTFFRDGLRFLDHLTDLNPVRLTQDPPLTLLDLNMPRLDGRTTLTHLRADMRFRHLPVVVLTTSCSDEDIESTYALGVTAYITKPSRESDLARVARFVEGYWAAEVRVPRSRARAGV